MAARWPDELALWSRIAEAGQQVRTEEFDALARKIRNEIADAF